MAGSSYGTLFKLTTFGESHGYSVGGIIEGFPAGFLVDVELVQQELSRRRPGQSAIVTQRKEADQVQFLSGMFEGKTTGTPIAFQVINENHKPADYDHLKNVFRPSHADYTYQQKYGHRDHLGGGRSSARETISRVVAGALAKQYLITLGIEIHAFVDAVGPISLSSQELHEVDYSLIDKYSVRCPNELRANEMESYIKEIRKQGDSVGGSIYCVVNGVPVGLGEPVFDKLHAELGKAMLSINAVKGFEIGAGFNVVSMLGSEHNDLFNADGTTKTNFSGGVQGGISNGMPIDFQNSV
jgi:chorismate synthase